MNRKHFIKTTGLSLATILISDSLLASPKKERKQLINFPDYVSAIINNEVVKLMGTGKEKWAYHDVIVNLENTGSSISVNIQAPGVKLSSVTLDWKTPVKNSSMILNDQWERTYGDASWHKPTGSEILPWYFMEHDGKMNNGFGVKIVAASFCFWQISNGKLSLTLDTHSGGNGVQLGGRKLKAAEIITFKGDQNDSPFQAARKFAALMCDKARMPKQPVYGINDWYFTYGNNSEKLILELTAMMAPMADELDNRPFSVIDAGWFQPPPSMPGDCCWGDNMSTPDENFGDMGMLAEKMRKTGMRPGLWTRPPLRKL